jgi:hypothetical protein
VDAGLEVVVWNRRGIFPTAREWGVVFTATPRPWPFCARRIERAADDRLQVGAAVEDEEAVRQGRCLAFLFFLAEPVHADATA